MLPLLPFLNCCFLPATCALRYLSGAYVTWLLPTNSSNDATVNAAGSVYVRERVFRQGLGLRVNSLITASTSSTSNAADATAAAGTSEGDRRATARDQVGDHHRENLLLDKCAGKTRGEIAKEDAERRET